MKRFMHRPISLLLAVLIVMSVFTIVPVTSAGAATNSYVKVISEPTDWSGDYLIVSEGSNVAFNGGLTTLDAVSNTIAVTISNNSIASNETTDAAKFTIAKSGTDYTIKSASGYYIGRTSNNNGLNTSDSTMYSNSISVDNGNVTIASNGLNLRFNKNNGQMRFRYFTSAQQAIQLYKLTSSGDDTPTYTVTWNYKDSSGNETSDTTEVEEGATPTHAEPESYDLDGMRYTFTGWSPALAEVTADTAYTAQYSSAPITYTVKWVNGETETDTQVAYNATPEYNGATPTKDADAQYTYTFDGWTSSVDGQVYTSANFPNVTEDVTYTAHFAETLNKYTVTWVNEGNTYSEELDYGATPAFDTTKGGELTKAETEDNTYSFKGWNPAIAAVTGDVTYTAEYQPHSKHETTDALTRDDTGVSSGGGYKSWKDVTKSSGAVYAGYSAGGNNSIQLNTSNSLYGIITTTSGGNATKINVKWNSHTADSRTLNIYGKNTPYSSAADLYSDSTAGTFLGTIQNGTTEFEIDGTYEYIGLRSASGALYLDEVDITWGTGTKPTHTVTWLDEEGDEIYHEDVQEGKTPVFDAENHTLPTKAEDTENTYRFHGWTVKDGDGTVYTESNMLKVGESDITFEPYFIPRSKFTENDNLYASYFTATGNSYKKFSNVASDGENEIRSEAVYAGHTAKHDSGAIQMNATSPNGIVTTASGGRASKVAVVWNSTTPSGRTLQIYGKDSAYDPDNWYSNQGSLLGTIVCGTSTELEITSPYEYIAIRSENNAVYLDKIEITWDTTAPTPHTVTWMNGEDEIYHTEVAYNTSPVYDEANYGTPSKADDDNHYTFSGWTDGVKAYAADAELPKMKKDTTYTATFADTPIYTVLWKNGNVIIETDKFYGDPIQAHFDSPTPTKDIDSNYSYIFLGWKDEAGSRYYSVSDIPEISGNKTFTAIFSATPRYKSGRIVSTSDNTVIYTVAGKYYKAADGDIKTFTADASFSDTDSSFSLGEAEFTFTLPYPAESITDKKPTVSVFAHTAYVTGEGTQDDPFVFYPNFIYSADVSNVNESNALDKTEMHPGDVIKGMARLRVGYDLVRFLQYTDQPDNNCQHGTQGFMGVSRTKYGYRYQTTEAMPYDFVLGGDKLYYLGELNGAHNFSETVTLDTELGAVIPDYTVTWNNYDGTLIDTNRVYQGHRPAYSTVEGADPTRPDDDDYRYTFSGWKDGTNTYGKDDELPVVTGDITYTATYTPTPLTVYTVTWLDDNGTELAKTDCKDGKIPVYPNANPTKDTDSEYIYTFGGWTDGATNYPVHHALPAVLADTTFTAYYNTTPVPDVPSECTVTWKDWNGSVLGSATVPYGSTPPHYEGTTPTKDEDADYTYEFMGWNPYLLTVTYDVDLVAQYAKTPKVAPDPIADIENIYPTDDGMTYDLKGMFYSYNGSEPMRFNWDERSAFRVEGATLTLGGKTVADIGIELKNNRYVAEFVNTVFVTGTGSYSQPYVFHPNYTYSSDYKNINQGCPVAMNEDSMNSSNIANIAYPGDSFKGTSSAKMTPNNTVTHDVRFITKNGEEQVEASYYVGVGTTTYGTNYSNETADRTFSEGCDTLWYHGEDDHRAYVFAETPPVKQTNFGEPETFTVTWVNDNGSKLDEKEYFYGETPSYDGTPTSAENPTCAFSGWTPEVSEVTEDITYTATYSSAKFFAGHSLTLKGDIGIYFYIDVTAAGITPEDIKNGNAEVTFSFSWKTSPAPYSDLSKSNIVLSKDNYSELFNKEKGLFKIKCNTAAAEMTCVVHADAVVTGSVSYTDTDDYSVYEYGMTIVNDPVKYGDDLVALAKAMLDYGAKAQVVFGIKTDDLANKELTGYSTQTVTAEMIASAIADANDDNSASDMRANTNSFGLEYYGSSMVFLSETTLRHYYTIKDQGTYDSVKNDTSFTLDERKLPFVIFERVDISAKDLDTLQVFTIGGQTYYYSVLDFSKSIINNSNSNDANKALAMATYWYNQAANNYFDNL